MNLDQYMARRQQQVERHLERCVPESPDRLIQAMRYSLFAGGKRIRPILCVETARIFDDRPEAAFFAGCAIEFIHTYSLIHDDLPAMDDDNLRRGRPTCHVVFGEAMAILAGDALLTQAFQSLADCAMSAEIKVRVISEVAQAAGTVRALIGGQVLDLQFEGQPVTGAQLEEIHRAKTGALIRCAVRIGAIIGGASARELQLFTEYGEKAGLSFQIADDLLDETATSEQLGKTAGKDAAKHKATYAALYGVEGARQRADQLCREAIEAVKLTGREVSVLEDIARFIVERKS